jgi:hypothetical protein
MKKLRSRKRSVWLSQPDPIIPDNQGVAFKKAISFGRGYPGPAGLRKNHFGIFRGPLHENEAAPRLAEALRESTFSRDRRKENQPGAPDQGPAKIVVFEPDQPDPADYRFHPSPSYRLHGRDGGPLPGSYPDHCGESIPRPNESALRPVRCNPPTLAVKKVGVVVTGRKSLPTGKNG